MEFLVKNWWYLLVVGGLAFVMFRGCGCCGGASHRDPIKKNGFDPSENMESKEKHKKEQTDNTF